MSDTVTLDEGFPVGIDWDGGGLLVLTPQDLLEVTPAGEVAWTYAHPVYGISDIAWDGEGIWVIHWGPKDFPGNEPLISRFLLP